MGARRPWDRPRRNSCPIGRNAAPLRLGCTACSEPHVVASWAYCSCGWLCVAVPPCFRVQAPVRQGLAPRNQARRLPGYRAQVGKRVRLYSRPGNDLTYRFPLIVEAIAKLRSRSCIIDGEAVACGDDGIACFD